MQIDGAEQTVCSNCGAGFSPDESRCPYCSALNPSGAERAYMDRLDDLKDETGELADDAEEGFGAHLKRNARRTLLIALVAFAALAALIALGNCVIKDAEQQALQEYKLREEFRMQHFEELDRLYESGDDEALSLYVYSLLGTPGFDALHSWKHEDFLEAYEDWTIIKSLSDDAAEGRRSLEDYAWSVSLAFQLAQLDTSDIVGYSSLSRDEENRVAPYRAYARQFLKDSLQMNEDELAAFADAAKDEDGYIDRGQLKQNLEMRLKQLGTSF